jgi:Na+-translocating ferredoxin:NAD+ oxidoreductase RNF subunit RnfB
MSNILGLSVIISGPIILIGIGFILAIGLSIAMVKLRVEKDPRAEKILGALPGANCGGCGFAGCGAFAQAVADGKAPVSGCLVGGADCAKAIAEIMGIAFEVQVKTRPVIHCTAFQHQRKGKKTYHGIQGCKEANLVTGVQGCTYGCLGYGDCVASCKFGALHLDRGLPEFNYAKCTSCGACAKACPRGLIEMIPFTKQAMLVVGCSNRDPAKVVREICEVGCLGCGACSKKSDVFGVDRNLACIDYTKFDSVEGLQAAYEKCPSAILVVFGQEKRISVKDVYAKSKSATDSEARPEPVNS